MKIDTELDLSEAETLFDILQHEIIKHSIEAKCRLLCKEISESRYEWHLSHAKYLESIKKKLLEKA